MDSCQAVTGKKKKEEKWQAVGMVVEGKGAVDLDSGPASNADLRMSLRQPLPPFLGALFSQAQNEGPQNCTVPST